MLYPVEKHKIRRYRGPLPETMPIREPETADRVKRGLTPFTPFTEGLQNLRGIMPALNFKQRFADAVESGRKKLTIRAPRKDGRDPKPGERLYLYTGMRTKSCRKLGESTVSSVEDILITDAQVFLNGHVLNHLEVAELADLDGFDSISEFKDFFCSTHGLPFRGRLIEW